MSEEIRRGFAAAKVNGVDVRWETEGADVSKVGDATVALGLMPAMWKGEDLRVESGVSPRLLSQTDAIQELLSSWDPRMKPIRITAPSAARAAASGRGTGLFFSGGVDSFYSLVAHRGELTHLVTINGFENIDDTRLVEMARAVAAEEGLHSIVVTTNARNALTGLDWLQFGHGAVLASAGLLLQNELQRVLVASSSTPKTLKPVGTHPHLDPLWSTESLEFIHDAMLPRQAKLAAIADDAVAMRWLRVCWRNPRAYNCGECEKCLRTMIMLELNGQLGACATLPTALDLGKVGSVRLLHRGVTRWRRLYEAAESAGRRDVARAVQRALRKNRLRNALRDAKIWGALGYSRLRSTLESNARLRALKEWR